MTTIPLKPENSRYTDGQWQAVYDSGDNILVSASAGSGKTTVLVQRVIEKIKNKVNVDELLIVTYTEAAAKEMKQRIQEAVEEAITNESDPEMQRHFIHQLTLLPTANISTLHAFCLQVIRKYYYLIEIDPVFRLLTDETEMTLLKEDVWSDLRESLYETDQKAFYELTENFSSDRSDQGLQDLVFSLYDFARSNPNPAEWLASLANEYDVSESIAESNIYQKIMKPSLVSSLRDVVHQGNAIVAHIEGEELLVKQCETLRGERDFASNLLDLVEADQLEQGYELLHSYKYVTYRGPAKASGELAKEMFEDTKALRNQNKDFLMKHLKAGFFKNRPSQMVAIMKESKERVKEMARVATSFNLAYSQRKEEKNVVDFNDLEHFTLQILANYQEGQWTPTEASLYYREKFSEVLVDEYQDINQLQENILYWLRNVTENEGNLFMVGDVKQSIYSFRLADPTLFIEKYNKFGQGKDGRRIVLAENFRSRRNVLDFTNLVFEQLMNTSVGQLEYDDAARLVNGFTAFPEAANYDTELLLFAKGEDNSSTGEEQQSEDMPIGGEDTFEIDDKTEGELRIVGNKIRELIKTSFPVYDKKKKEMRPIQYKDIVLLTPTKKNNLLLLDIFKEMDIPLHVNDTQNYFQATEIRIMIALLNVIDNPYQDIPLASVLRSPIVGLNENELATVRLEHKQGTFYDALQAYLNHPNNNNSMLYQKVSVFYKQLLSWRELARRKQLVHLIWQIYQDTGFLDYVGGMPAGKQRQANLHALYERATSYEEMSFKGLFQFVRFIEKMQQKDKDLAEPTTISEDEDAVRVMTIHASKGLEFPVVFVLDLSKNFNLMDLRQKYVLDDKLGAGIDFVDTDNRLKYETLPKLAIKEEKKKKLLSEEMRKLYVALTRAEEKLFLVGSYKDEEAAWNKWSQVAMHPSTVLPDEIRLNTSNMMDWIGYTLMRHQDSEKFQTEYDIEKIGEVYRHPAHFSIEFFTIEELKGQRGIHLKDSSPVKEVAVENNHKEEIDLARKRLAFNYPYEAATKTASYQSVSEIKRVFEDPDDAQLLTLDLANDQPKIINRFAEERLAQPKFLETEGTPKGTEIGTATHLVMQLIPLEQSPTEQSVQELINELVENHSIEKKVAQEIKIENVLSFFQTEFGEFLQKFSSEVVREQPFSMLMNAESIFKDYPCEGEDKLLIHGIIDGYVETETELILYDFKTDFVRNPDDDEELTNIKTKYKGQLQLYKKALEQVKGRQVTSVQLILLSAHLILEL